MCFVKKLMIYEIEIFLFIYFLTKTFVFYFLLQIDEHRSSPLVHDIIIFEGYDCQFYGCTKPFFDV